MKRTVSAMFGLAIAFFAVPDSYAAEASPPAADTAAGSASQAGTSVTGTDKPSSSSSAATPAVNVPQAQPQTSPAAQVAALPDPGPGPDPETIGTLKIFKQQGADINYLGRKYGLDGWLITKGTAVQVVYTTLDGQATVAGMLYGADGTLETTQQLLAAKEHGLKLPNTLTSPQAGLPTGPAGPTGASGELPSERLWKEITSSTYYSFGPASAPPLYVFMDPRCHYCQQYYNALTQVFIPQNKVQLRVIPVGILGADSVQEAKQIISARDPAAAWAQAETGNLMGLPTELKPDAADKLTNNQRLMGEWKLSGTPGSIYRSKDGKVKLVYGVPHDVQQVIDDLGSN